MLIAVVEPEVAAATPADTSSGGVCVIPGVAPTAAEGGAADGRPWYCGTVADGDM